MFKDKNQKKKHHPYRGLAVFTLAAAGMISLTNRVKGFFREKMNMISSFMKKDSDN